MCCVQLFHRHSSRTRAPVPPWHLHQRQGTNRFQQPPLPQKFSGLCTVLSLRQLYKEPLAVTDWHIRQVLPPPLSSHFKTKHKGWWPGSDESPQQEHQKANEPQWTRVQRKGHSFLYQTATKWPCRSSSCRLSLNIFGWIWWQLKWTEHCQSSSEAGSIAWSCNSNSTMVRGWVVWNTHCNQL